MRKLWLTVGIAALALTVSGEEIRDKVLPPTSAMISDVLQPESALLGVPFGTTEDQTIQKLGRPTGYLTLTNGMSALVYGNSTYLLFRGAQLVGGSFGQEFVPYSLRDLLPTTPVSVLKPILDNGVHVGLKADVVKTLVGPKGVWAVGRQTLTYTTAHSTVILTFTFETTGPGTVDPTTMPDRSFALYGMTVLRNEIVRFLGSTF